MGVGFKWEISVFKKVGLADLRMKAGTSLSGEYHWKPTRVANDGSIKVRVIG